jgi:hypothetical protein
MSSFIEKIKAVAEEGRKHRVLVEAKREARRSLPTDTKSTLISSAATALVGTGAFLLSSSALITAGAAVGTFVAANQVYNRLISTEEMEKEMDRLLGLLREEKQADVPNPEEALSYLAGRRG